MKFPNSRNKSKLLGLIVLGIAGLCQTTYSQETFTLDLEKSIALALDRSHSMRTLRERLEQSKYQLKAATSNFKTHVDLEMYMPQYTETISQWEDSTGINFFPQQQLMVSSILTIRQPLPTDGDIFIRGGFNNINDIGRKERVTHLNTLVGFTQPLTALYSYNHIRSEFKRAQLDYERALKSLKRNELDLVYFISQAFYQTINSKERMNISLQTLERQREAAQIAKDKYNAGLIREVESLQMEVDLVRSMNDYDINTVAYYSQMNLLKQRLGLNLSDSILLISDMSYEKVEVDENMAVDHGMANRMELREHEIGIELSEIDIKRTRSQGQIRGEIYGSYELIGTGKYPMPISIGESFGNSWDVLRDRPGNFRLGLTVNIPIIDWGENKARVKAAESRLKMNQISLDEEKIIIELEIRNTVRQLRSSLRRVEMLERNLELAEKSFDISKQRFANGDIDSQAMALERDRLNGVYIDHLKSYIDYKLLLADLMRKSFYDFESGKSVIEGEI